VVFAATAAGGGPVTSFRCNAAFVAFEAKRTLAIISSIAATRGLASGLIYGANGQICELV
jgi:hypothetical protein